MLTFIEKIPLSYYALTGLINFLTSSGLGLFIYSRNKKASINKIFAFFCLTVAQWSLFYFIWLSVKDKWTQEFCLRTCMIGVAFMPVVFTHFILHLLNLKIDKKILYINYFISILIIGTIYTPLYATDFKPFLVFPCWGKAGVIFPAHLLHFFVNVLYSHYMMIVVMGRTDSLIVKKQISYVFIGTIIGYLGGIANYLCWYRIPIPPVPNVLVSVYVGSVAYAIIRHRLMDIEVVIKKTLIFATLFTIVFGIFIGITLFLQRFFVGGGLVGLAISSAIIIFAVRPLEDFLVKVTDKYLFQKKYDPFQLLKTFSDKVLASVLDQAAIIKITVDLLAKALNLKTFALMLVNREGDKYELSGSFGIDDKEITFSKDSGLVAHLKGTLNPVLKKEREEAPVDVIVKDMNSVSAELCIPLVFHKELVGILCFGKKKSDEEYTNEDLNILVPLTRDITIATVYAKLYEEIRQKDKLATMGTLIAGIKHEVGNPLAVILTSAQLFLKEMEGWDSKGLSQKDREESTRNALSEILDESRRIGRITKKFTDFAKPGDDSVKEAVKVTDSINEALDILGNELSVKHITIEKNIPPDIPSIFIDKDQAHQIFFNILRNAAQAIDESKKSKENSVITISARRKSENMVVIDIADTGPGIPDEKKDKIFDPFYTTKQKGKGTGLGLAIVRQLVGKNKGEISFESEEGKGTTFTLEFPISKNG